MVTEKIGGTAGRLFKGRPSNWSIREQLAGTLHEVRFLSREERYEEALVKLEAVLAKDPDFPEALFLKAQIIWEGFNQKDEAKLYLCRVIKLTDKDDTYHNWAASLYRDLIT